MESEFSKISAHDQEMVKGGIQRDANGDIIFTAVGGTEVTHPSGEGGTAGMIRGYIYADDGTAILSYKNVTGSAGWDTDCHGATFASGQFWINDDQVAALMSGDNYIGISSGGYYPGDVVVYYDENGNPVHSATLTSTGGYSGIVYGQGGLETENHYDPIDSGFTGHSSYRVYRKGIFYG